MSRPNPSSRSPHDEGLAKYAGLGFQFAATLLAFGALGYWLDGKAGTRPWLMIAGFLLGGVGATVSLIKKVPPPRGGSASRDRARNDSE